MNKTVSLGSALLCTFIWGTTFIAQETGMQNIGPYVFNGVRFFVGFLALIPFYLFQSRLVFFYFLPQYFNKLHYFIQMWQMLLFLQFFMYPWFLL